MGYPTCSKGVFNLSNQLSNFLKDRGMLRSETEFNRNSRANFTIFLLFALKKNNKSINFYWSTRKALGSYLGNNDLRGLIYGYS